MIRNYYRYIRCVALDGVDSRRPTRNSGRGPDDAGVDGSHDIAMTAHAAQSAWISSAAVVKLAADAVADTAARTAEAVQRQADKLAVDVATAAAVAASEPARRRRRGRTHCAFQHRPTALRLGQS